MNKQRIVNSEVGSRTAAAPVWLLLAILYSLLPSAAFAGAELTSGYTYGLNSPSNIVTYANLNSHVKDATLAPGAITNRTAAAAWSTNFWLLVASNGTLYRVLGTNLVPASSISTNEINTDIAGLGLGGGGGFPLSNKLDNAFLKITNDVMTVDLATWTNMIQVIATNVASAVAATTTTNIVNTNKFVSYDFPLINGGAVIAATNHGLGGTPQLLSAFLVCQSTDQGYAANDLVPASAFYDDNNENAFAPGMNATQVWLALSNSGTNNSLEIKHKTTGAGGAVNGYKWKARIYARP